MWSTGVAAILAIAMTSACSAGADVNRPASIEVAPPAVECTAPAPTTAAGYAELWSTIPADEWGAGDVSISVQLDDRRVWLYGDTVSAREDGFVHSSAITQTGGCLHVSDEGAQLLPDDDPTHIYWIHDAHRVGADSIAVRARSVELTGTGAWAFADNGFWRTATVRLEDDGDLRFVAWSGKVFAPEPDSGPLIDLGDDDPHHFGYAQHEHTIVLANGRSLWTLCQSYDDGRNHGFDAYRPLFADHPWVP